jgi:hypothetical protein
MKAGQDEGRVVPGPWRVISAALEGTTLMTRPILEIRDLEKTYEGGFTALKSVSLDIRRARSSRFSAPTVRERRR